MTEAAAASLPVVRLRASLRRLAGGRSEHPLPGATVVELLRELERREPALAGWILDERGPVRRLINVFVSGELGGEATAVGAGDRAACRRSARSARRRSRPASFRGLWWPLRRRGGPPMKVAVVGKGNVGGGLADLWGRAGHEITRIGRGGGDVSGADAVLLAVPGGAVAEALGGVQGVQGKTVIDATNLIGAQPPQGFASNAEFVKSRTGGPTAKSFNINFARLYDRIADMRERPGNLWCGDDEARETVEQLSRDAGYDPVYAGSLENAAAQEQFMGLVFSIVQGGMGPFFYRIAPPDRF